MKKSLLLLTTIFLATWGYAQSSNLGDAQLNFGLGYSFGGNLKYTEGDLKVKGGAEFNIGAVGQVSDSRYIGMDYSYIAAEGQFATNRPEFFNNDTAKLNVHYFSVLFSQYYGSGNMRPFTDFGLGAGFFIPSTNYNTKTYFSFNFKGGVYLPLGSSNTGLKLGAGFKMPILSPTNGDYCGIGGYTGANCGLSLTSTSVLFQPDVSATLVVNLK